MLAEGRAPVEASETLSEEQFDLETIDLGLRTIAGVDLNALDASLIDEALAQLRKSGLVMVAEREKKTKARRARINPPCQR